MKLAIQITLGLQLALAVLWNFLYLTADSSNWGILLFFILVFGAHIPLFLFAAWGFWKHPALRRPAGWALALPFASLAISLTVRELAGDALSGTAVFLIIAAATLALLLFCVLKPARATRFLPNGLFASRGVNRAIIALQVLGWLLPVIAVGFLLSENAGKSFSTTDGGMGLAYLLVAAAVYLGGNGLFALFAGVFGWLGLRGNSAVVHRGLHITQLVLAAPMLLLGIGALLLLYNAN